MSANWHFLNELSCTCPKSTYINVPILISWLVRALITGQRMQKLRTIYPCFVRIYTANQNQFCFYRFLRCCNDLLRASRQASDDVILYICLVDIFCGTSSGVIQPSEYLSWQVIQTQKQVVSVSKVLLRKELIKSASKSSWDCKIVKLFWITHGARITLAKPSMAK